MLENFSKHFSKNRVISLVLAVAMLAGVMPVNVFANNMQEGNTDIDVVAKGTTDESNSLESINILASSKRAGVTINNIVLPNGDVVNGNTAEYVAHENGDYTFKVSYEKTVNTTVNETIIVEDTTNTETTLGENTDTAKVVVADEVADNVADNVIVEEITESTETTTEVVTETSTEATETTTEDAVSEETQESTPVEEIVKGEYTYTYSVDSISTETPKGSFTGITNEYVYNTTSGNVTSEENFVFDEATQSITSYTGTDSSVYVPNRINGMIVLHIAENAFMGNESIKEVYIPTGIETIGNGAFKDSNIEKVVIADTVNTIGEYAFSNMANLTTVALPSTLTTIAKGLFLNSAKLENVLFPSSLESIGASAFENTGLKTIILPDSVATIGERAFYGNGNLNAVVLLGVENIGASAFENSGLTQIILGDKLQTVNELAFKATNIKSVNLPSTITNVEINAFEGLNDTKINIAKTKEEVTNAPFGANDKNISYSDVLPTFNYLMDGNTISLTVNGTENNKLFAVYTPDGTKQVAENNEAVVKFETTENGIYTFKASTNTNVFDIPVSVFATENNISLNEITLSLDMMGMYTKENVQEIISLKEGTMVGGTFSITDEDLALINAVTPENPQTYVNVEIALENGETTTRTTRVTLPEVGQFGLWNGSIADIKIRNVQVYPTMNIEALEDSIYAVNSSGRKVRTYINIKDKQRIADELRSAVIGQKITMRVTAHNDNRSIGRDITVQIPAVHFVDYNGQNVKTLTIDQHGVPYTVRDDNWGLTEYYGVPVASRPGYVFTGWKKISRGDSFPDTIEHKEERVEFRFPVLNYIADPTYQAQYQLAQDAYDEALTKAKNNIDGYILGNKNLLRTSTNTDGTITITDVDQNANTFMKKLVLPEYIDGKMVTKIGNHAFKDTGFSEIYTSPGITELGEYSFESSSYNSKHLEKVVLNNAITKIGQGAFLGAGDLTRINMPMNLEHLGTWRDNHGVFENAYYLKAVTVPSTTKEIGVKAFKNTALESFTIPKDVTVIEGQTFMLAKQLESIYIESGNKLNIIRERAFADTPLSNVINLPSSVRHLQNNMLGGITGNGYISIRAGVTDIYQPIWNPPNLTVHFDETLDHFEPLTISAGPKVHDSFHYIATKEHSIVYGPDKAEIRIPFNSYNWLTVLLDRVKVTNVDTGEIRWINMNDQPNGTISYTVDKNGEYIFELYPDTTIVSGSKRVVSKHTVRVDNINEYELKATRGEVSQFANEADILKALNPILRNLGTNFTIDATTGMYRAKLAKGELQRILDLEEDTTINVTLEVKMGDKSYSKTIPLDVKTSSTQFVDYEGTVIEEVGKSRIGQTQTAPYTSRAGYVFDGYTKGNGDTVELQAGDIIPQIKGQVQYKAKYTSISDAYDNALRAHPDANDDNLFTFIENAKKELTITGLTQAGKNKEVIVIPPEIDGKIVTGIKEWTFQLNQAGNVKEMYFPSTIRNVGLGVFLMTTVEKVVLNEGITSIGHRFFADNSAIKEVVIPKTLTTIGDKAFNGTTNLKALDLSNVTTFEGSDQFKQTKLETVTLSNDLTKIPQGLLNKISTLSKSLIAQKVEDVARWAVEYNDLEHVQFNTNLKTIGQSAFAGTDKLETVYFPNTLTTTSNVDVFAGNSNPTVFVNKPKDNNNGTFGGKKVYWRGEFANPELHRVTYHNDNSATIRIEANTHSSNVYVTEVLFPNGTRWKTPSNQNLTEWKYDFNGITRNGIYTFILKTSNGAEFRYDVIVDKFNQAHMTVAKPNAQIDTKTATRDSIVNGLGITAKKFVGNLQVNDKIQISNKEINKVKDLKSGQSTYIAVNVPIDGVINTEMVKIEAKPNDIQKNLSNPDGVDKVTLNIDKKAATYNELVTVTAEVSRDGVIADIEVVNAATNEAVQIEERTNTSRKFYMPDFPIKVTGKFTAGDFLTKFVDYDGIVIKEQELTKREIITSPYTARAGYIFDGYVLDGATERTADAKIKEGVILQGVAHNRTYRATYKLASDAYQEALRKAENNVEGYKTGTSDLFTYTTKDREITITGLTDAGKRAGKIVVPSHFGDKPVVAIANDAFMYSKIGSVKEMYLPSTIKTLGNRVFFQSAIEKVVLSEGITEIPQQAFNWTRELKEVTIPQTVTKIGKWAFDGALKLKSIDLSNIIIFEGLDNLKQTKLENLQLSEGLKIIPQGTFNKISTLKGSVIAPNVEMVGPWAFEGTNIEHAQFEKGTKTVHANAFATAGKLETVYLPGTLETLPSTNVFSHGTNPTVFVDKAKPTENGEGHFGGAKEVYWRGEFASPSKVEVKYNNNGTATIRTEMNTHKNGLYMKEVVFPDGSKWVANANQTGKTWNYNYNNITKNGIYTFKFTTSNGVTFRYDVIVDKFNKSNITTTNNTVALYDKQITEKYIIEQLNATVNSATPSGGTPKISISDADVKKIGKLKSGQTTNITVNATLNNVVTSKSMEVMAAKNIIIVNSVLNTIMRPTLLPNQNQGQNSRKVTKDHDSRITILVNDKVANEAGFLDKVTIVVEEVKGETIVLLNTTHDATTSPSYPNGNGARNSTAPNGQKYERTRMFSFIMPDEPVGVSAVFRYNDFPVSIPKKQIQYIDLSVDGMKVDTENIVGSKNRVKEGKIIDIEVTPPEGHIVKDVIIRRMPSETIDPNANDYAPFNTNSEASTISLGNVTKDRYEMRESPIEISAVFEKVESELIKVQAENGSIQFKDKNGNLIEKAIKGDTVKVVATPNANHRLKNMTIVGAKFTNDTNEGTTTTTANPAQFVMGDEAVTVTPTFEKIPYMIDVNFTNRKGGGKVVFIEQNNTPAIDPATGDKNYTVYKEDRYKARAVPQPGYQVKKFTIKVGNGNVQDYKNREPIFSMRSNIKIDVEFERKSHNVTSKIVRAEGIESTVNVGTVTFENTNNGVQPIQNATTTNFNVGDMVKVNIAPEKGYKVKSVTGTNVSTLNKNNLTFEMPDNAVTVTVEFEKDEYTVNQSNIETDKGSLKFTVDNNELDANRKVQVGEIVQVKAIPTNKYDLVKMDITATDNDGNPVEVVFINGSGNTTTNETATFKMPKGKVKVEATFKLKSNTITWVDPQNGTITLTNKQDGTKIINGVTLVPNGTLVEITAKAETGYVLKSLKKDSVEFDNKVDGGTVHETTATFNMEINKVKIEAEFKKMGQKLTINIMGKDGGTVDIWKQDVNKEFKSLTGGTNVNPTDNKPDSKIIDYNLEYNDRIRIKAIPNPGYETKVFTIKYSNVNNNMNSNNEQYFNMLHDVTIMVTFKKKDLKAATVVKGPNGAENTNDQFGTATLSKVGSTQVTETFKVGDTVKVTVAPALGYKQVGEITVTPKVGNITPKVRVENGKFTMPAYAVNVNVKFEKDEYLVSQINSDNANGKVTFKVAGKPLENDKAQVGKEVQVKAVANNGYKFESMTINAKNGNEEVDVKFKTGNAATSNTPSNSFIMPKGAVTITAIFKLDKFNATVKITGPNGVDSNKPSKFGTVELSKVEGTPKQATVGQKFTVGDTVKIKVNPSKGYKQEDITVTDANGATKVQVTGDKFTMPAHDVKVTVKFAEDKYTITQGSDTTNGTLTFTVDNSAISNAQTVQVGQTVNVTANPTNSIYKFGSMTIKAKNGNKEVDVKFKTGNTATSTISSNSFEMPAGNVTITATFIKNARKVTVTGSKNGTITLSKTGTENLRPDSGTSDKYTVSQNDTITVTATPKTGYKVQNITIGGADNTINGSTATFTVGGTDINVNVTFVKATYTINFKTNVNSDNHRVLGNIMVKDEKEHTIFLGRTSNTIDMQMGETITITAMPKDGYEVTPKGSLEVKQGTQTVDKIGAQNANTSGRQEYEFTLKESVLEQVKLNANSKTILDIDIKLTQKEHTITYDNNETSINSVKATKMEVKGNTNVSQNVTNENENIVLRGVHYNETVNITLKVNSSNAKDYTVMVKENTTGKVLFSQNINSGDISNTPNVFTNASGDIIVEYPHDVDKSVTIYVTEKTN